MYIYFKDVICIMCIHFLASPVYSTPFGRLTETDVNYNFAVNLPSILHILCSSDDGEFDQNMLQRITRTDKKF
jgi:hypothetical protein